MSCRQIRAARNICDDVACFTNVIFLNKAASTLQIRCSYVAYFRSPPKHMGAFVAGWKESSVIPWILLWRGVLLFRVFKQNSKIKQNTHTGVFCHNLIFIPRNPIYEITISNEIQNIRNALYESQSGRVCPYRSNIKVHFLTSEERYFGANRRHPFKRTGQRCSQKYKIVFVSFNGSVCRYWFCLHKTQIKIQD